MFRSARILFRLRPRPVEDLAVRARPAPEGFPLTEPTYTRESLIAAGLAPADADRILQRARELAADPAALQAARLAIEPRARGLDPNVLRARRLRDSFKDFIREFWHVVEPATPYMEGRHMVAIADHLQAVADGRITRLLITIPPGHAKSLLCAVMFPAWMWLRNPKWRVLCGSYAQDLSTRDAQRARDLIRSSEYGEVKAALGQAWKIAEDMDLKQQYMTTEKGFRLALAVGGKATGFRGDCVPGRTIIETEHGPRTVAALFERACVDLRTVPRVLAFDARTGSVVAEHVLAVQRKEAQPLLRITHANGELRCTSDHLVWTEGRGWIQARNLKPGTDMLRTPLGVTGISRVERVAVPEIVYDIQVDRCENFFADGVLVHNCLIFDDLVNVKEPEKITRDSLEQAKAWWNVTMSSRLNNLKTGVKIGIMQRVSEFDPCEDLIRRRLPDGRFEYDLVALPSEYDPDLLKALGRPADYVTSIGWKDWRSEPGELLFPELFPREVIEQAKQDLGSLTYAANHQQRPTPSAGGFFRRHWWRFWYPPDEPEPPPVTVDLGNGKTHECGQTRLPKITGLMLSCDLAFKDTVGSDFVAMQCWAYGAENPFRSTRFLIDQIHRRMDFPQTLAALRGFSELWPQASLKLIEDKANGPAVIATLRGEMSGIVPVEPLGGKEARANAVSPQIESGHVYIPHPKYAPWVEKFLAECHSFPKGAHDDQVDAMTQALARKRTIVV